MNSVRINPKLTPSDQESSDEESEKIKIHKLRQFSWKCNSCSIESDISSKKKYKSFENEKDEGLILNILKNKNNVKKID